jgi:hypothetical protein
LGSIQLKAVVGPLSHHGLMLLGEGAWQIGAFLSGMRTVTSQVAIKHLFVFGFRMTLTMGCSQQVGGASHTTITEITVLSLINEYSRRIPLMNSLSVAAAAGWLTVTEPVA